MPPLSRSLSVREILSGGRGSSGEILSSNGQKLVSRIGSRPFNPLENVADALDRAPYEQ